MSDILKNAMISELHIEQFGNTKTDESLTDEVVQNHNLGKDAGGWKKAKFPPAFLKPISKLANFIRGDWRARSLPWENGRRIVTAASLAEFRAIIAKHNQDFEDMVRLQCSEYFPTEKLNDQPIIQTCFVGWDAALAHAKYIHNGTFNPSDYPTREEFINAFKVSCDFYPIPCAAHVLKEMAGDLREEIQAQLESRNEIRVQAAISDAWQRLLSPVQHMAQRLADPEAVFRDSLVGNIREITSLIPSLNLANSPELVQAAAEIELNLSRLNVEELRTNKVMRKEVAQQAAGFVARFGALGTRKMNVETKVNPSQEAA